MSDYLNKLAARALGRREAVRPRLASIYEPHNGAQTPPLGEAESAEPPSFTQTTDVLSTIRPTSPTIAPLSEPRPPAQDSIGQGTFTREPQANYTTSEPARESREMRPSTPSPLVQREALYDATVRLKDDDRNVADRPRTGRAEPVAPVEVVRQEKRMSHAADAGDRREAKSADAVEESMRELRARVASLEAAGVEASKNREAVKTAASPNIPAPQQPSPPALAPRAAPPVPVRGDVRREEPPQINVTIGRVEVRAVFPASSFEAPRPAAPRPNPAITLAEYLKQRERGRR